MTFTPYEQKMLDELKAKDVEIEVLTQERDNALLRIEELESELAAERFVPSPSDAWDPNRYRGGVNPNA